MEPRSRNRRGASYIEVLVAALILSLSLLAALSLFGFGMTMTGRTGDEGVAYNLARRTLEDARAKGAGYGRDANGNRVYYVPDGNIVTYYDGSGAGASTTKTSAHVFSVTRDVSSDRVSEDNGVEMPADDAIRSVVVEVRKLPSNELLIQTGTHLVRSGV